MSGREAAKEAIKKRNSGGKSGAGNSSFQSQNIK